jgi:hypothetical protein
MSDRSRRPYLYANMPLVLLVIAVLLTTLVTDPRSSVNGVLLTGSPMFREVSLEERGSLCRLKQSAADDRLR